MNREKISMMQNLYSKANQEKLSEFSLDYFFIQKTSLCIRFGTYTLTCNSTFHSQKKIMIQYVGCYKSQLLPKDEV